MSKSEPTIQKYMTTQPYSIDAGETIVTAVDLMKKFNIRHLPVMKNGKVAGIVSDRDIKLAESIQGLEVEKLPIVDVCVEHPYTVHPETPVSEVALTMASMHYGSAIVLSNEKLVGIFTTVDACRALAEVIAQRFHTK